ncbi:MAG: hypothetical protein E7666_04240 [Ruminococcaceae bacterium]|nr:hypothetical protein [Oscillospiraceae bacterium]
MKKILIILLILALLIPFSGCEKQSDEPDEYYLYPQGRYLGNTIEMPYCDVFHNTEYIDETAPQTVSIQVQGASIEFTYEDTRRFDDGFIANYYDADSKRVSYYADGRLNFYRNNDYYYYLRDHHTIKLEEYIDMHTAIQIAKEVIYELSSVDVSDYALNIMEAPEYESNLEYWTVHFIKLHNGILTSDYVSVSIFLDGTLYSYSAGDWFGCFSENVDADFDIDKAYSDAVAYLKTCLAPRAEKYGGEPSVYAYDNVYLNFFADGTPYLEIDLYYRFPNSSGHYESAEIYVFKEPLSEDLLYEKGK